jgi:hypothetical protein
LPKSKVRKKSVYTPPEGVLQSRAAQARVAQPSPRWYAALMVTLMVIGLLWIVVYYVAGDRIPFMVSLGAWNFAIGFGAMVAGLVMSMRWRGTNQRCTAGPRPVRGRGPASSRAPAAVHRRTLHPQVDMTLHPQGCPPSVERRNGPGRP